jgi:hypothetical protein
MEMSETIHWYDKLSGKVIEIDSKDIVERLGGFGEFLETIVTELKKIEKSLGAYKLTSFQVSLDLSGTIFVVTAEGSITLTFSLPQGTKA